MLEAEILPSFVQNLPQNLRTSLIHIPTKMYILALAIAGVASSSVATAISCLNPGQNATATWKNALGQTCTWTGLVGANFGKNTVNGGEYDCQGRWGICQGAYGGDVLDF